MPANPSHWSAFLFFCLMLLCCGGAMVHSPLWNFGSPRGCQDVRKLAKGCSGPAELAGILVGDVILGINYKPLEKGLVHTSALLAEAISLAGFVKLQVSQGGHTRLHTARKTYLVRRVLFVALVTDGRWETKSPSRGLGDLWYRARILPWTRLPTMLCSFCRRFSLAT